MTQLIGITTWTNDGSYQWTAYGTKFQCSTSGTLSAIEIYINSTASVAWKVAVYNSTGTSLLGKGTLSAGTRSLGWYSVTLDSSFSITKDTYYWLVLRNSDGSYGFCHFDNTNYTTTSCYSDITYASFPASTLTQTGTYSDRAYGMKGNGTLLTNPIITDTTRLADSVTLLNNLELPAQTDTPTLADTFSYHINRHSVLLEEYASILDSFIRSMNIIVLDLSIGPNDEYNIDVFLDNTRKIELDYLLEYAGRVTIFNRPFKSNLIKDTSHSLNDTVTFYINSCPSGIENPLTLVVTNKSSKIIEGTNYFLYSIVGYKVQM